VETTSPGETARARAESAGQGHLFAHWDQLDAAARERLVQEVDGVDFGLVAELVQLLSHEPSASNVGGGDELQPPELFPLQRDMADESRAEEARSTGGELLADGKVGYLLVAGGQASRLGYDGPKGDYAIGPVSGWTLFQYHARRLLAARQRYGAATPWYVMTSRANHDTTLRIFAENDFFGLPEEDVRFFTQAMVPAVDFDGRILMSGPGELFLAPNGHGGSIAAFADSGALADARARGLEHLSYFQVDNPLARPADPLFLGLHARAQAGMSSKVVSKRDPGEKVGVLGRVGGRMGCIEYSDLPESLRDARDADGQLSFRAGNIAIHALALDFVEALSSGGLQLPWHVAKKEMKVWGAGGPTTTPGAKFETFVFDALGKSESSVTLEVERAVEFSPVKNAEGDDSPATCQRDLCRLFSGWAEAAEREPPETTLEGVPAVEVDPLFAEDREAFLARAPTEPESRSGGHLYR
jgi:UDP-N-acetylglucosamine/UDP-N-acetylgalactosamine diphosphorylase